MSRQIDADALFGKIAGHSYYHGDKILSAIACMAEGKEVGDISPCELPKNLNILRDTIYKDAVAHGLWEGAEYETPAQMGVEMYHAACRIGDEILELKDEARLACGCKAHGYSEELADIIIMALSVAGHFNIDIDAEIHRKMAINKERPWKHGKE